MCADKKIRFRSIQPPLVTSPRNSSARFGVARARIHLPESRTALSAILKDLPAACNISENRFSLTFAAFSRHRYQFSYEAKKRLIATDSNSEFDLSYSSKRRKQFSNRNKFGTFAAVPNFSGAAFQGMIS
jgi:hypothetical protein